MGGGGYAQSGGARQAFLRRAGDGQPRAGGGCPGRAGGPIGDAAPARGGPGFHRQQREDHPHGFAGKGGGGRQLYRPGASGAMRR
ncbi:hypothetical protein SDC9_188801 [bioreactor metagenome]|uniref:Uncharacterized protein n=1 Tax=bioreactor metagenome TaxID=1076179 RepID=A0A645HSS6_9ZZZZ